MKRKHAFNSYAEESAHSLTSNNSVNLDVKLLLNLLMVLPVARQVPKSNLTHLQNYKVTRTWFSSHELAVEQKQVCGDRRLAKLALRHSICSLHFICCLFNDDVSNSVNIASNLWTIVINELERVWREVIVA
jgi:hypothetical protein